MTPEEFEQVYVERMARLRPRHEALAEPTYLDCGARRTDEDIQEVESFTADQHDDTAEWLVNYQSKRVESNEEQMLRMERAKVHALLGISKHLNEVVSLLTDMKQTIRRQS